MKNRFQGAGGNELLVETLKNNLLVKHNAEMAIKLAAQGELVFYGAGQVIIEQGATDSDLYLVLAGEVVISINQRLVATRGPGISVGEMGVVDPTSVRSATVVAKNDVVLLKVSEGVFNSIASEFPQIWEPITLLTVERLRRRDHLHRAPNVKPVVFLGCSTRSLSIANEIQAGLQHDPFVVNISTQGVFGPSGITIDAVLAKVNESDFAAFVFSDDDQVISKDERTDSPRDNLVFELGLFMGLLGRGRTFIVKNRSTDAKMPTDLSGMTPITYTVNNPGNLSVAVLPVCTALRNTGL
ncbi:MAG TPA: TIR domain-containing protein [Verrucomicrobiae bacterium]|jgi:predicted nucleotide-binding protein|nr:TIR domain-containing protein [Verrucomicrobiae bacterium]